jgi:hypothetical protein
LIQKLREICEELTHDGDLDLVSTMLKPISHGVSTPMRREEREIKIEEGRSNHLREAL